MSVVGHETLSRLFKELSWDSMSKAGISIFKMKLEFKKGSETLFEISPTNEVILKTQNEDDKREIVNCLERSGAVSLEATIMPSCPAEDFRTLSSTNAKEWIGTELGSYAFICIDTNIIMKNYCSNYLLKWLGDTFCRFRFRIPRLSILEIERISNEEISGNNREGRERKKRLGLQATSEIMFLKKNCAELLPLSNKAIVTSFLEKAGNRAVDSWIRQEIFEFASLQGFNQILFMTNDLANGLAAYSEGFDTCVFSRSSEQELFIEREGFSDTKMLAKFVKNISIAFGNVLMNVYSDGTNLKEVYEIQGIWSGKTPYDWVNRFIRFKKIQG
jgi:hypothetical protein